MAPRSKPKTGEMPVDSITPADDERLAEAEVVPEPAEAQPPEGVVLEDPEFDRVIPEGEATEAELELLRQAQEIIAAEQAAEAEAVSHVNEDGTFDAVAAEEAFVERWPEAELFEQPVDWAPNVGFPVRYVLTGHDIDRLADLGQATNSLAPGDVLPGVLARECTEVEAWDLVVFVPSATVVLPVSASVRAITPDGDPVPSLGGHWFF